MIDTGKTHLPNRLHRYGANLFFLAIGVQLLVACSGFQHTEPDTKYAAVQNQRAAVAASDLGQMQDIDTLIRLNNRWFGQRIEHALVAQATSEDIYSVRNIKTIFYNQIIILEATVDILDEDNNTITATVWGDVLPLYRDKGLQWQPRFTELQINSKDFVFAGSSYTVPDPELTRTLLHKLNRDIAQAVVESGRNTIALNPVPLGEIQVGAELPGFVESSARSTQSLRGVFRIAGSTVLIEPSVTSIALDMAFIPDLSTCPADITVSRAEFARDVKSREPVGITRNMGETADAAYFFSEISGAKRPLTIIHYWFADGLPVATQELPVGASERWRTWSSNTAAHADVSQWEVLVVEKASGCILASKSIRALEPEVTANRPKPDQTKQAFTDLRHAFSRKTSKFSSAMDKPGIALIETTRPFLRAVLQAALADLSIDAKFDPSRVTARQFTAQLQSFDPAGILCEHRDCAPAPACKVSLGQCKRLRDTRNCSSCEFRNPLNNRCVSEAVDPLCEAARTRQNERYDAARNTCIAQAEHEKRECDRLNAQALKSCQIESGFEESACESVKTSLGAISANTPLANISARAQATGSLIANFSNFVLADELDALKVDMTLQSRLQLEGELSFEPLGIETPLTQCIAAWSKPFLSRLSGTSTFKSMLSDFDQAPDMLTAQWSGFGVTTQARPSPLESLFIDHPQLLANCNIGLKVDKVETAITGEDAAFFQGQIEMIMQALPAKIHLSPATIAVGNQVHSARASLTSQHLRYDIRE